MSVEFFDIMDKENDPIFGDKSYPENAVIIDSSEACRIVSDHTTEFIETGSKRGDRFEITAVRVRPVVKKHYEKFQGFVDRQKKYTVGFQKPVVKKAAFGEKAKT